MTAQPLPRMDTRRRPAGALLALALSAAALAAPGTAGAAPWSAPQTVAGSHTSFQHPFSVAAGHDGTLAVVFRHRGDVPGRASVHVAVRRPDGHWESTKTVSDLRYGAAQPRIAVDRRGRVLAVWVRPSSPRGSTRGPFRIQARVERSPGHWGPIATLGTSAHFFEASPAVAWDGRGDATVVWRGYRHAGRSIRDVVKAAYMPAGGHFGPAATLSKGSAEAQVAPTVAMSPGGRSYVAWSAGNDQPVIDVAVRGTYGRWSAPRQVSGKPASAPQVAVAADGSVVVAWREAGLDSEGEGIQQGGIGAAVGSATGKFAPAQHVADAQASSVLLAAGAAGETLLAWESASTGAAYAVRPAGGAFGPARAVAGAHAGALAVFDDGTAALFWSDGPLHVTERPAGGDFAAPQDISPAGAFPAAAAATSGAAVWLQGEELRIATSA